MGSEITAVLFDATGTLIELREPLGETYARFAREFGVDLPAWRLGDAFGRIFRQAPPMVFPNAPAEEVGRLEREWLRERVRGTFRAADSTARFSDFDAFFARLFATFATAEPWRARPGCRPMLAELRARGLATGVVSNFDQRLIHILQDLDLKEFLDVVMLPAEARAAKPDGRIFALALERLGVPAAEAAFVGDDLSRDLRGARAAGLAPAPVLDLEDARRLLRRALVAAVVLAAIGSAVFALEVLPAAFEPVHAENPLLRGGK